MGLFSFTSSHVWVLLSPLVLITLWRFIGRLLRGYFIRRYTTIQGLPLLGLKREQKVRGTAVVCGGR